MFDVFISYARSSEAQARRIEDALRGLGYSVWRDDQLPAHRVYSEVLEERLRSSKAILVLWSAEAVRSDWVRAEADVGRERGKLVQASVADVALPLPFNQVQCADLRSWRGDPQADGWRKVVDSIAELVGRIPGDESARANVQPQRWWGLDRRLAATLAAAVLAIAGAGLWMGLHRPSATPGAAARMAILPIAVAGADPVARAFADSLRDGLVTALTGGEVQTIPTADADRLARSGDEAALRAMGVGLTLGGVVRREGGALNAHLVLDDPQAHATLWSKDFRSTAETPEVFRARVVERVAGVALMGASPGLRRLGRGAAASFLEASFQMDDGPSQREVELLRDVVASAPDFAPGHAQLALAIRDVAQQAPPDAQTAAISEARGEAQRALALDPHMGAAYSLLGNATPLNAWGERERLFQKGLAADPHWAGLSRSYGRLLGQVGRNRDAVDQLQKAASIDVFGWSARAQLAVALTAVGRADDANAIIADAEKLWPDTPGLQISALTVALNNQAYARARPMLDAPGLRTFLDPEALAAIRTYVEAMQTGDAARKRSAADAVDTAANHGVLPSGYAVIMLGALGDLDAAFRQADRTTRPEALQRPAIYANLELAPLFLPLWRNLRRDPRFMRFAARLGLTDYWRASGRWPDFCAEPGLLYDCAAEAARLARGA